MHPARRILAAAAIVGFGMSVVHAADQTILGDTLQVKNPSTTLKRKVLAKAKEKASANTIVGDPTVGGATLTVRANGGTPSTQTFSLPVGTSPTTGKPFWSGDSVKGFKYKDPKYDNGPIKGLIIKKSGSGTFQIKALGLSKVAAISVLPPNPGTDGCVLLQIGGGDSYSVKFGALDGKISNKGALEYKHKKPSGEGTCVTTTTTTSTTAAPTTTTLCVNQVFTFNVGANDDTCLVCGICGGDCDLSDEWQGGSEMKSQSGACTVTVSKPNDNIDKIGGIANSWSISGFAGFSNCFAFGGEDGDGCNTPNCDALAASGSCFLGRPSCSSALGGGGSSASYNVQCLQ